MINAKCRYCGTEGDCRQLVDHPDEGMGHLVPVLCGHCGSEFVTSVADAPKTDDAAADDAPGGTV